MDFIQPDGVVPSGPKTLLGDIDVLQAYPVPRHMHILIKFERLEFSFETKRLFVLRKTWRF